MSRSAAMQAQHGSHDAAPTAATRTTAARQSEPFAYSIAPLGDGGGILYTDRSAADTDATPARRDRWAASLAALLVAAAAFIVAAVHGVRTLASPPSMPAAVSTVTPPVPDPNNVFLAELFRAGITPGWSRNDIVNNGYSVCVELGRSGKTEADVSEWFGRTGAPSPEMFVAIAHKDLCPRGHL